jgi:hypothetical protein
MLDSPQYLYVLSNKSMPGLLKVGYTRRDPARRVRELSSTEVPTPFEIRLVLIVRSGADSEMKAHRVLGRYRKNKNREFFECSEEEAIGLILDTIEFERVDWRYTHRNSSIGALVHLELSEQLGSIRSARAEIGKELNRLGAETTMSTLEENKRVLEARLNELGGRPVLKESSTFGMLSQFVYQPFPIGWAFWFLAWYLFSKEFLAAFAVIASLFLLGGVSSLRLRRREKLIIQSTESWRKVDEDLSEIEKRLSRLHELLKNDEIFSKNEARVAASISIAPPRNLPSSGVIFTPNDYAHQTQLFESGQTTVRPVFRFTRHSQKKRTPYGYHSDKLHTIEWEGLDYVYASDEHARNAIEKFERYGPPWSPFGLNEVRRAKSADRDVNPIY